MYSSVKVTLFLTILSIFSQDGTRGVDFHPNLPVGSGDSDIPVDSKTTLAFLQDLFPDSAMGQLVFEILTNPNCLGKDVAFAFSVSEKTLRMPQSGQSLKDFLKEKLTTVVIPEINTLFSPGNVKRILDKINTVQTPDGKTLKEAQNIITAIFSDNNNLQLAREKITKPISSSQNAQASTIAST